MTFPTIQISLGGGELSDEVRGRIDIAKVGSGASLLKNMFVKSSGGISNRTGMEYVIHCINDTYPAALIPFQFNIEQTYMLLLQSRVLRIIKDGEILTNIAQSITGISQALPGVVTSLGHDLNQDGEIILEHITGPALPTGMEALENRYFNVDLILDPVKAITGATQTNPVEITSTGHSYINGDRVYIINVGGMTHLNARTFTVTSTGANTFTLDGEDGTNHTAYGSGGTAQRADPDTFELRGEDTSLIGPYNASNMSFREIIEVIIPYDTSEVLDVDYTQSNDVLTMVHPKFPPANLSRFSDFDWRYEEIIIEPTMIAPLGVGAVYSGTGTGIVYDYRVTAFNEETGEESVASIASSIPSGDLSVASDKVVISWSTATDATIYNIYKAEDGSDFYGYIGSSNSLTFTDRNVIPEFSDSPALSVRDPFDGVDNRPSVVEYYQGRRYFANTNNLPTSVYGSVSGNFQNFNVSKAVKDDDAVTATLAAKQANAIQALVPLGEFIVFTSGSEWLLKSSGTSKLVTPNTVSFEVQSYWGSIALKPIVVGSSALFVTGNDENDDNNAKFSMVRDLQYTLQSDNFSGNELSVLSTHLFRNKELVDWAYAQVPYSLIWAARNDGLALTLTYVSEHELFAWSQHETQGLIERVATIREGGEDTAYFVVRRNINGTWKRMVERLHSTQFDEVEDWFGVDAGVTFDQQVPITGATNAEPVVITFGANIDDFYLDGDKIDISGMTGMTELNGKRFVIANKTSSTVELQSDEATPANIDGTLFGTYFEGGISRTVISTMTGLDHLEGESVVALADGNVVDPQVVVNGQINLNDEFSRVHCGLSYVSDFQTIDANIGQKDGIVFGTVRKVDGVTLRFYKTVGGQIGSSEDKLYDIKWRKQELWGEPGILNNRDVFAQVHSRWDRVSKVFYRQPHPLPVTILSIVPEISKGDD